MKKSIILAIALAISCSTPKIEAAASWGKCAGYGVATLLSGKATYHTFLSTLLTSNYYQLAVDKTKKVIVISQRPVDISNIIFPVIYSLPAAAFTCYCAYNCYKQAYDRYHNQIQRP